MSETKENAADKVEIWVPFGALTVVSLVLYQVYQVSGAHGAWLIPPIAYVALCLTACLAMLDTPSRLWVAGTLRKGQFTQIYVAATQRRLDWLWARFCNPVDATAPPLAIFRAALSTRLCGIALLITVLVCLGAMLVGQGWFQPLRWSGVALLLAVFVLVNGAFDFLSCAVTLTLVRLGLRSGRPLVFGVSDLVIAVALSFALGATLVLVVEGLGRIAGTSLLDYRALFSEIAANPQNYLWIYAMVLSTLIPTLAHAALSLLGFQALAPLRLRRTVADLLRDAAQKRWKAAAAPLALGALWMAPFAVLGALGWMIWWGLGDTLAWLGRGYLDALGVLSVWVAG